MPPVFASMWLSLAIFVAVPLVYFMPGRTIEKLSLQDEGLSPGAGA